MGMGVGKFSFLFDSRSYPVFRQSKDITPSTLSTEISLLIVHRKDAKVPGESQTSTLFILVPTLQHGNEELRMILPLGFLCGSLRTFASLR
jgi:hypothetical protein